MSRRTISLARRLWWPLCAIAALIVLRGCAYSLVNGDRINSKEAAKIEVGIQDVRQLRFTHPVPLVVKTPDEAEAMMEADMMRDYTDDQIKADAVAGEMVGLYPAGIDLKAASLKLLKSQVAGFYDPHGKEMVLVEGGADLGFWTSATEFMVQRDVVGEMLLAHELTHALQDQNFDLGTTLDKEKDDDDRALALKTVAEGDATLAGFAYAVGRMDDSTVDALADNLKQLPSALAAEAPDTPEGLSAPLLCQYSEGVRFVGEAYRRGGWQAVDAMYRNPPQSSHEILHPALYFGSSPAAPQPRIKLAGYDRIMSGWRKADADTYGELMLRVILERNLGKKSKEVELASHWAADQMIILQENQNVAVIWMIAFSDVQTAERFAIIYQALLAHLSSGSTPDRIGVHSNNVLIVIGQPANYFDALAPAIWSASTIGPSVTNRAEPSVASDAR
ncbi:MAG TPA: hypothetical protein VEY94_13730 [Patescibacteria group bacterium]|nr:hypothetical protein [Patescibacteria group bacterium]